MEHCSYTSCFFACNVLLNYFYGYFKYSIVFLFLLFTSFIHHSMKTIYTYILDKLAILIVIFVGGYILYTKIVSSNVVNIFVVMSIFVAFFTSGYLYYYGYIFDCYCFDLDRIKSDWYHGLMHFIASVGHIMIVIL
jgi:hypothetical protein